MWRKKIGKKINKYSQIAIVTLLASLPLFSFGQVLDHAELVRWNADNTYPLYVKLEMEKAPSKAMAVDYLSKVYGLKSDQKWIPFRVLKGELGFDHVRYHFYDNQLEYYGRMIQNYLDPPM